MFGCQSLVVLSLEIRNALHAIVAVLDDFGEQECKRGEVDLDKQENDCSIDSTETRAVQPRFWSSEWACRECSCLPLCAPCVREMRALHIHFLNKRKSMHQKKGQNSFATGGGGIESGAGWMNG